MPSWCARGKNIVHKYGSPYWFASAKDLFIFTLYTIGSVLRKIIVSFAINVQYISNILCEVVGQIDVQCVCD